MTNIGRFRGCKVPYLCFNNEYTIKMVDISQGMACIYRRIVPVYESSKEKGQICAKPTTSKHSRESKQSYAKLNMTEKRSHMHPETLQLIMILKLNKSLWPSELAIQEILDKTQDQSESEDEDQDDDDEDDEDEEEEA